MKKLRVAIMIALRSRLHTAVYQIMFPDILLGTGILNNFNDHKNHYADKNRDN